MKFLDVQKKRLKKRIYKAVNLSAAHSSHDARLAWQIVLKFLFSRRRYLVGLTIVSALAAIFEGATMAALGLAVSLFVDKGVPEISGLPDSIAIQFGELLRDGGREKIFIIITRTESKYLSSSTRGIPCITACMYINFNIVC